MPRHAGRPTSGDLGRQDPPCTAPRHGTVSAYRWAKCTCPEAREAKRLYDKRLRQGRPETRLINATGTTRRIRALMALGHTAKTIGEAAGRSAHAVTETANARRWVTPETAAVFHRAYDTLSMTPGVSYNTRGRALAWGWAPPLAWDDDTIDDPDAAPRNPKPRNRGIDHAAIALAVAGPANVALSKPERTLVGQRMTAAGVDRAVIAERLGIAVDAITQQRVRQHRVAA